jgi:hypothetical protein
MDEINECFGIGCYTKVAVILYGNFIYCGTTRLAMLYEIECCVVEGQQKRKPNIEKMRKLQ